MGNSPQQSCVFKVYWKCAEDQDQRNIPKNLWPVNVVDIDMVKGVLKDYVKGAKLVLITNVASY